MQKVIAWIKENKLSSILIALLVFLFVGGIDSPVVYNQRPSQKIGRGGFTEEAIAEPLIATQDAAISSFYPGPNIGGGAPRLDIQDRKVTTNSNLSLVVSDVREAIQDIVSFAKNSGGYMVNSSSTSPEGLSNGTITIRVPSDSLDQTLDFLRGAAVKVVSENLTGRDITDQYVDVEARLATLNETKARYEEILDSTTQVDEILNVTQQILYIQDQIDNLTGRLEYLDASANSSLVTVYLSTDELELPFSPDQPWRPEVVFKYAVRSVVQSLRDIGDLLIWTAAYAVFWIPALVIFFWIKKRSKSKKKK